VAAAACVAGRPAAADQPKCGRPHRRRSAPAADRSARRLAFARARRRPAQRRLAAAAGKHRGHAASAAGLSAAWRRGRGSFAGFVGRALEPARSVRRRSDRAARRPAAGLALGGSCRGAFRPGAARRRCAALDARRYRCAGAADARAAGRALARRCARGRGGAVRAGAAVDAAVRFDAAAVRAASAAGGWRGFPQRRRRGGRPAVTTGGRGARARRHARTGDARAAGRTRTVRATGRRGDEPAGFELGRAPWRGSAGHHNRFGVAHCAGDAGDPGAEPSGADPGRRRCAALGSEQQLSAGLVRSGHRRADDAAGHRAGVAGAAAARADGCSAGGAAGPAGPAVAAAAARIAGCAAASWRGGRGAAGAGAAAARDARAKPARSAAARSAAGAAHRSAAVRTEPRCRCRKPTMRCRWSTSKSTGTPPHRWRVAATS
jgi:hypothetical protein